MYHIGLLAAYEYERLSHSQACVANAALAFDVRDKLAVISAAVVASIGIAMGTSSPLVI